MCQAIFEHQCKQVLNPSLAIPPPCFDYESGDFDRDVEGCSPLREIAEEALPPNHNTATVNLFHTIISRGVTTSLKLGGSPKTGGAEH